MYILSRLVFAVLFISVFTSCLSKSKSELSKAEKVLEGNVLFKKSNCTMCHGLSNETRYGPSLNDIFHRNIQVIRNGKTVSIKVDADYIIRSIKEPDFERRLKFKTQRMPKTTLTDKEIEYISEYLVSLNNDSL